MTNSTCEVTRKDSEQLRRVPGAMSQRLRWAPTPRPLRPQRLLGVSGSATSQGQLGVALRAGVGAQRGGAGAGAGERLRPGRGEPAGPGGGPGSEEKELGKCLGDAAPSQRRAAAGQLAPRTGPGLPGSGRGAGRVAPARPPRPPGPGPAPQSPLPGAPAPSSRRLRSRSFSQVPPPLPGPPAPPLPRGAHLRAGAGPAHRPEQQQRQAERPRGAGHGGLRTGPSLPPAEPATEPGGRRGEEPARGAPPAGGASGSPAFLLPAAGTPQPAARSISPGPGDAGRPCAPSATPAPRPPPRCPG